MDCDSVREAVSALLDGETPGLTAETVEAHLAGCAECRAWRQSAHDVTRRARLGTAFLERDLTADVLAAAPPLHRARRARAARRIALLLVGLLQVAITVPLLVLGHDRDAGLHAAHELGCFDLGLAIAFLVGAWRPSLSAGLAWPCGIAAAGLVTTAVIDMIAGQTPGLDEAQHLVALAGAALLVWQARVEPRVPAVTATPLEPASPTVPVAPNAPAPTPIRDLRATADAEEAVA